MALRPSKSAGGLDPTPLLGLHYAVCYGVLDMGEQYQSNFDKWQPKIMLQFEFPDILMEEGEHKGKPRVTSKEFTNTTHEMGNYRQFINSWKGREITDEEMDDFDPTKFIGKGCQLQMVLSKNKKYANVQTVVAAPKGKEVSETVNAEIFYEMTPGMVPDVPEWIQKKIESAREFDGSWSPEDDVPSGPVEGMIEEHTDVEPF